MELSMSTSGRRPSPLPDSLGTWQTANRALQGSYYFVWANQPRVCLGCRHDRHRFCFCLANVSSIPWSRRPQPRHRRLVWASGGSEVTQDNKRHTARRHLEFNPHVCTLRSGYMAIRLVQSGSSAAQGARGMDGKTNRVHIPIHMHETLAVRDPHTPTPAAPCWYCLSVWVPRVPEVATE